MKESGKDKKQFAVPIEKNQRWIEALEQGIDALDEDIRATIMKPAGESCASDIRILCEKYLGRRIYSLDDLIAGWNKLRENRGLNGRWEITENHVRGVFEECGCPLIASGLVKLHPTHCYCSQAMMHSIFEEVTGKPVDVEIKQSIGRGDDVCDFLISIFES